jgi:hypothetical protein
MPKKNAKCKKCALEVSTAAAMQRSCWVGDICKKRRYYYRSQGTAVKAEVSIDIAAAHYAVLRLWQSSDGGRHAIGLEVWRGSDRIAAAEPQHVIGVGKKVCDRWIADVLEAFRGEFPGLEIRTIRESMPIECPIASCPLKAD